MKPLALFVKEGLVTFVIKNIELTVIPGDVDHALLQQILAGYTFEISVRRIGDGYSVTLTVRMKDHQKRADLDPIIEIYFLNLLRFPRKSGFFIPVQDIFTFDTQCSSEEGLCEYIWEAYLEQEAKLTLDIGPERSIEVSLEVDDRILEETLAPKESKVLFPSLAS